LRISPEPAVRKMRSDYFGNRVCFFSIQELHRRLEIVAECEVRLSPGLPPEPEAQSCLGRGRRRAPGARHIEALDAQQFAFDSTHVRMSELLAELAEPVFSRNARC
jgi:hypothetical protein